MDVEALQAKLRLDASGFQTGLAGAQQSLETFRSRVADVGARVQEFGATMRRTGAIMTAALTVPIVAGAGKAIMAASDLNEAIDATNDVFKDSAEGIQAWSKTTAGSLGISRQAALSAAVGFAGMGKQAGYTGTDLNDFSTNLVQAAADLGSFYNVDPGTVLEDLRSGLAGESEPLRKYNIYLNEATVAQKAMAMTGKTNADQLTEGEKIAARAALVMENLGDAEGNVAKTSKSLANQLRFLRSRLTDLSAKIGTALLPIALKLVTAFQRIIDGLENISPGFQKFVFIVLAVVAAAGPLLTLLGFLVPGFALLLSPIGLVAVAIGALAYLFKDELASAFSRVVDAVGPFVEKLGWAFEEGHKVRTLVLMFPKPLREFARGFLLIADAVGDVVSAFRSGGLMAALRELPDALSQIWEGVQALASAALDIAIDTAVSLAGWLWDHKDDIWGGIKALAGWTTDTFTDAISATIDGALSLAGDLATIAADFGGWLKRQIQGPAGAALAFGPLPFVAALVYTNFQTEIDGIAGRIAGAIGPAIVTAIGNLANLASEIGTAVVEKIKAVPWSDVVTSDSFNVGVAFGAALRGAIAAAANIVTDVAQALYELDWSTVPGKIAEGLKVALLAAGAVVVGLAAAIASFIGGAITGLIFGEDVDFATVVTKIQSGIQGAIDTAGSWATMLAAKGIELIAGVLDGAAEKWAELNVWLGSRDEAAVAGIGSLLTTLVARGVELIQGARDGAGQRWNQFTTWLSTRGASAFNAVGSLAETLIQRGRELIEGLRAEAGKRWDSFRDNWLITRGSAIASAVGDLAGILAQAGRNAMQSLWDGMVEIWNQLAGWLGGLKGEIVGLKGPPAEDARMLIENGMLVMQGFGVGLARGWADVESQLSGYTAALSGNAVGGMGGAGYGTTNHFGGIKIQVSGAGDPDSVADRVFTRFAREFGLREGS